MQHMMHRRTKRKKNPTPNVKKRGPLKLKLLPRTTTTTAKSVRTEQMSLIDNNERTMHTRITKSTNKNIQYDLTHT